MDRRAEVESRLERLSTDRRAYLERLLANARAPQEKREAALAPRRTRADEPLPLSFAQERLWFLEQVDPGSRLAITSHRWRFRAELRADVFEAALNEVVRRHEILRTTFSAREGVPRQIVAERLHLPLARIDLSALEPEAARREADRLTAAEAERPFDLECGPLLRATLLQIGPDHHVLLLAMHHIITDGWSIGVLFRELRALYAAWGAGRPSPLPELPIQYADFALWQRERLGGARLEAELAYWRARLADLPVLELPADRPRPALAAQRGASLGIGLDEALAAEVRRFAKARGATPFMVLLAGFAWLLHRASGQPEVAIGAPMAGRGQAELEGLIGFFVNSLVLRLDCSGDPSFTELVDRTREVVAGALAHQELPFERLVEELQPQRDLSRNPLFQVTFQLQQGSSEVVGEARPGAPADEPEATEAASDAGDGRRVGFDLAVDVWESSRGLRARFEYSRELFEAATIAALARTWRLVLAGGLAAPERPLGELALLAPDEGAILAAARGPLQALPEDRSLHELVAERALRAPEALALQHGAWQLSYAELERRANRLAWRLRRLGVGPETLVGVALERSPALAIALLGVLKAGGAYLPLDPRDPPARAHALLQRFGAALLIADAPAADAPAADAPAAADAPPVVRVLEASSLPELARTPLAPAPESHALASPASATEDDAPPSGVTPANLAYAIATSGSTGEPKGVEVEHRALVNHALATAALFELTPADRVLQFASPAFDVAAEEVFPTLAAGASLHWPPAAGGLAGGLAAGLAPDALEEFARAAGLTVLNLPTAYWHELALAAPERALPPSLRLVVTGSEPLAGRQLAAWRARPAPRPVLLHAYGVTEATITSTMQAVAADEPYDPVPIGRPLPNVEAYVLDERGRPLPPGIPGELYLGGAGLARGYRRQPESTARAFVPHPFAAGARAYRTGDRVRLTADLRLQFLGRLDDQLKVRGYRIEPGEIEAALAAHPSVAQAAVTARDDLLVAYVTLRSAALPAVALPAAPQPGALRAWLAERLPAHLVPGAIVVLGPLPRTPSGKVDRRALPRPELGTPRSEPPQTETERALAALWQEVLAVPQVGRDENFFDLGGHSLLLVRLASRLQRSFGERLTLLDLFRYPTVAAQAARLEHES